MPSEMYGSGRKTLPDVRALSGDTPGSLEVVGVSPGCSGVVWRPSRCPGVVERLSRMSLSGRETLLDVREWSEDSPKCPEWSADPPECP